MIKAVVKGTGLFLFGSMPVGVRFYRYVTQNVFGTMESHIYKMYRKWPGLVSDMTDVCGISLEKARLWEHEAGWTPYISLLFYITTGSGGTVLNTRARGARILARHIEKSIEMAKKMADKLSGKIHIPEERLKLLDSISGCKNLQEIFDITGGEYLTDSSPHKLSLGNSSRDVLLSGGQLEHYRPEVLKLFFKEAYRILSPGGFMIVTINHSDHLHLFDGKLPFLYHYGIQDRIYKMTRSNPLLYHNRMLPEEIMGILKDCGFEKIKITRLALPEFKYVEYSDTDLGSYGIGRRYLTERYKNSTDSALKTAAAKYIYRKPSG